MSAYAQHQLRLAAIEVIQKRLCLEAKKRKGRDFSVWSAAEAKAVWQAARDFAQQNGLRVPLLDEVIQVEKMAMGHSDYGAKWALYVAEKMFTERARSLGGSARG